MNTLNIALPIHVKEIQEEVHKINFSMSCDLLTGSILKTLAASKPGGNFLELGTGAGVSTSWIVDGMDAKSNLATVENNEDLHMIAQKYLGQDKRITFICADGGEFIKKNSERKFDFIFADTWPGKFYLVEETLSMLSTGGFYIIDDLLPVETWDEEHLDKVNHLIKFMEARQDLLITKLSWSTGLIIATKLT